MEHCAFDELFTKSLPHILEKIFLSLDYESFKNCMKVSKAWNELLTSETFKRKAKSVFQKEIKQEHLKKLLFATCIGNTEEVKGILSTGMVDVNGKNVWGRAALYVAAKYNHQEVVNVLLDAGANPNEEEYDGDTPLHKAVRRVHKEVIQTLVEGGADPRKENKEGDTPRDIVHNFCFYDDNKKKCIINILMEM